MATGTMKSNASYVLLWTNPNPNSSFSAQTISLNLSDYNAIMVEFYEYAPIESRHSLGSVTAIVGEQKSEVVMCPYLNYENNQKKVESFSARPFRTPDNTGVIFYEAMNAVGQNDSQCVPIHIYGIR